MYYDLLQVIDNSAAGKVNFCDVVDLHQPYVKMQSLKYDSIAPLKHHPFGVNHPKNKDFL